MSDRYRYVRPGQPIRGGLSAEGWNAALRAAREADMRRLDVRSTPQLWDDRTSTALKVRNDSGRALARFSVINLEDPLIGPADNRDEFDSYYSMAAIEPGCGFFAILQEPVADGEIGRALVAGMSRATVRRTDPRHKYAKPIPGTFAALQSSSDPDSPAIIVWIDDEPGAEGSDALVLIVGGAPGDCGSAACDDTWLCADNVLSDFRQCGTAVEIVEQLPNCCGTGSAGTGTGTAFCETQSYTAKIVSTLQDGTPYNCVPIDRYCLTGPHSYDCGNGILGQRWFGTTAEGTITITKCGKVTCVSGTGAVHNELVFSDCKPNPAADPCSIPDWPATTIGVLFGVQGIPNLSNTLTITREACGPKCWQDNVTGHKFCSGANESARATQVGVAFTDNAECALHCFDWGCWQSNTLAPTDPGYRYCANTDDTATATLVASYPDEAVCTDSCGAFYCVEWIDCDDEACTENCHPTTTVIDAQGGIENYPFCTDLASVLGGCFDNGGGGFTHYQILSGPYGAPDCDANCDPLT